MNSKYRVRLAFGWLCFFSQLHATEPNKSGEMIHQAEHHAQLCKSLTIQQKLVEAEKEFTLFTNYLDSIFLVDRSELSTEQLEKIYLLQMDWSFLAKLYFTIPKNSLSSVNLQTSSSHTLKMDDKDGREEEEAEEKTHFPTEVTVNLIRDTAILHAEIAKLKDGIREMDGQLKRYTTGIFLGLGFGYNYFFNGPYSYYIKPDSSLVRYGKSNGMSFIFSGFLAYKIAPRHSVIFNVPFGDITSREDYRVGIFNKKMAGGLGYGYNMGSVSITCIMNISPYTEIEYGLLQNEKFDEPTFSTLQADHYPSVNKYSPSITIGLSYNFVAPDKFFFDNY